jgi:AcrR family transcriptional regulator
VSITKTVPGANFAVAKVAHSSVDKEDLSHNLLGQRLGRKGRGSRERILSATEKLLGVPPEAAISLSAVAREASLGMTTLYLYFTDLTELLLAVLSPVIASAEQSYVSHLRTPWGDDALPGHCLKFVEAYHDFWVRHSRVLHLRNSYADGGDERMRQQRIAGSKPVIDLLVEQMEGDPESLDSRAHCMATVLFTGIERMITVTTDARFPGMIAKDPTPHIRSLLSAEARLLELGIRDVRSTGSG